jgi:hypothetical protein
LNIIGVVASDGDTASTRRSDFLRRVLYGVGELGD